jgi:hypothetical protein
MGAHDRPTIHSLAHAKLASNGKLANVTYGGRPAADRGVYANVGVRAGDETGDRDRRSARERFSVSSITSQPLLGRGPTR